MQKSAPYNTEDVTTTVTTHFKKTGVTTTPALVGLVVDDLTATYAKNPKVISQPEMESIVKDLQTRPQAKASTTLKVCVFGGGAFGTALACALARMGHTIVILMLEVEKAHVESINKRHINTMCFSDQILPPNITATLDEREALRDVSLIVHAIPVQFSRGYLQKKASIIPHNVPILSVSKGITLDTLDFMDDVIKQGLGRHQPTAFLAGPTFAIGVIRGVPTWATIASEEIDVARKVQKIISSTSFRVYSSSDVRGVEACAALKNVLSILCGMSLALGLGPNTTNGLITRGWNDLRRLVVALGGKTETMSGLSGIGDLMLTCYGGLSRNAKFGELLAKGKSVKEAQDGAGGVVEGLPTSKAAAQLAQRLGVRCPVLNAISVMLQGKLDARELVTYVMTLPLEDEFADTKISQQSKL